MSDDQGQGFMDTFGYGLIHMNFLAHIGFGFLGLSYLTKRMVHLRLCLCLANAWLVAWGVVALSGEAAWAAAGWNLLFFFSERPLKLAFTSPTSCMIHERTSATSTARSNLLLATAFCMRSQRTTVLPGRAH